MALLSERSWNPLHGARGVRRQIQDLVENPLAERMLSEEFKAGDIIEITAAKGGQIVLIKGKNKLDSRNKSGNDRLTHARKPVTKRRKSS